MSIMDPNVISPLLVDAESRRPSDDLELVSDDVTLTTPSGPL